MNSTANTLKVVAFVIWVLGGLGGLISLSSLSEIFSDTPFDFITGIYFMVLAFSVFTSGLTFYALSQITQMVSELKSSKIDNVVSEKEDEVLTKF